MDLREIGCEDGRWMELAQDRVQWRDLVLAVLNLRALPFRLKGRNYIWVMNNVETEVKDQIDYKSLNSIIEITYIFKYRNEINVVFT
jgi:hypothetical protein